MLQPFGKGLEEGAEPWFCLALPLIDGFIGSIDVFFNGISGKIERAGNSANAFTADEMATAYLGDSFHNEHSRLLPQKRRSVTYTRGGQIWTLITPETCSLLHAVLHHARRSSRRRDHSRRPLTPPYVRFRIRRFMLTLELPVLFQQ